MKMRSKNGGLHATIHEHCRAHGVLLSRMLSTDSFSTYKDDISTGQGNMTLREVAHQHI